MRRHCHGASVADMQISARNQLRGTVRGIRRGEGEVTAVIKASDVMLATE